MFALEIYFQDGVSQAETILVRRPQALIGASDFAHVVVEDMRTLDYQLRVVRDVGRSFRCIPVGADDKAHVWKLFEGVYDGEASFDLGPVRLHLTALDYDMLLKESEPADRAGVRVMRQACAMPSPMYPAVVVLGAHPMVVSFVPDQPILLGRSKKCALRLDSADISGEHARIGYESGSFWVEDLGSTNGTYVRQAQVAGRISVAPGEQIIVGREVVIVGITAEDQLRRATRVTAEEPMRIAPNVAQYPVLVSLSELVRPSRMILTPGMSLNIGRDPGSDVWLGAPHVSRRHCSLDVKKTGEIQVTDHSMNGTAYDGGLLRNGERLDIDGQGRVFDFGGGVTVAICYSPEEEQTFAHAGGAIQSLITSMPEPQSGQYIGGGDFGGGVTQDGSPSPLPGVDLLRGSRRKLFGGVAGELLYDGGIRGRLTLALAGACCVFLVLIVWSLVANWK